MKCFDARRITCTWCGARPGHRCVTPKGQMTCTGSHMARIRALRALNARIDSRQPDLFPEAA